MELQTKKTTNTSTYNTPQVLQPKYRIAELIRKRFGELAYKEGLTQLAKACNISRKQTIQDWLLIEAGSNKEIHSLVLPLVLQFFGMQTVNQLLTKAHKELLKPKTT